MKPYKVVSTKILSEHETEIEADEAVSRYWCNPRLREKIVVIKEARGENRDERQAATTTKKVRDTPRVAKRGPGSSRAGRTDSKGNSDAGGRDAGRYNDGAAKKTKAIVVRGNNRQSASGAKVKDGKRRVK